MKLITAEEIESVISEIGTYQNNGEFKEWTKRTMKEKGRGLMDLVRYRMADLNHIDEIDCLYFVFLGVKIGRGQVYSELEEDSKL